MFAVAVAETFQIWRVDCGCDVLSWMMKTASFTIVVVVTHPLNPHHDRCFDFARQFVHARYVQNDGHNGIFEDSEDDDDDQDTPRTEMQEIKEKTVQSKFGGKQKEKKKIKKKLFQYGKRGNMAAVDSEEDESSEEESSDDDESDSDDAGNNIKIHAVSIDAAKETLRAGGE